MTKIGDMTSGTGISSAFAKQGGIDAWVEIGKLAREINPNLPTDLSSYELRITMNKDFQGIELIDLRFTK